MQLMAAASISSCELNGNSRIKNCAHCVQPTDICENEQKNVKISDLCQRLRVAYVPSRIIDVFARPHVPRLRLRLLDHVEPLEVCNLRRETRPKRLRTEIGVGNSAGNVGNLRVLTQEISAILTLHSVASSHCQPHVPDFKFLPFEPPTREQMNFCPYFLYLLPILVKSVREFLHGMPLGVRGHPESRCSNGCASLKRVNVIWPIFSAFFPHFWKNSAQRIFTKFSQLSLNFPKIDVVTAIFST
jgi:hypothetical protein